MVISEDMSGTGIIQTRGDINYIWTCAHVVVNARKKRITPDLKTIIYFDPVTVRLFYVEDGVLVGQTDSYADVIRYSEETSEDIALLRVRKKNFSTADTTWLRGYQPPEIGTPLYHYGCMRGFSGCLTEGIVAQPGIIYNQVLFDRTTVIAYRGSSGGGVYRKNGICIGLLESIYMRNDVEGGVNNVIPARRLIAYAKRVGVSFAVDPHISVPANDVLRSNIEESSTFYRYRDFTSFTGDLPDN